MGRYFSAEEAYENFTRSGDDPSEAPSQVPDKLVTPSQKALGGGGSGIPSGSRRQVIQEFVKERGKAPSNKKELIDFYNQKYR